MVKDIEKRLLSGGIENAKGEARELYRFCSDPIKLNELIEKRLSGYPLQYIIGEWDFYDLTLFVGEGVLIPRADTEILVDKVLELSKNKEIKLLDLCSGSGAIVLSVANRREGSFFALEKSKEAFYYLEKNNQKYGGKVNLILADLFDYDSLGGEGEFDFITANPPYLTGAEMENLQKEVSFEPEMALDGGEDGLIFYRYIISEWKNLLKDGGSFFFEIGEDQGEAVSMLLEENGFDSFVYKDYNNHDRMVIGRMK